MQSSNCHNIETSLDPIKENGKVYYGYLDFEGTSKSQVLNEIKNKISQGIYFAKLSITETNSTNIFGERGNFIGYYVEVNGNIIGIVTNHWNGNIFTIYSNTYDATEIQVNNKLNSN